MKYGISFFILWILLAGCNAKHSKVDQVVSATDSIPQKIRTGGLFDSVHDARLRGIISVDSLDLLAVKHVMIGANPVEQILYIERGADRNSRFFMDLPSLPIDSPVTLLNPLREMNGSYIEIFSYKGRYMTALTSEIISSDEIVIEDSAMIWIPDGFNLLLYKSGERTGNKVKYVVSEANIGLDTIEIKMLQGDLNMQLWKWSRNGEIKYSLKVPKDKIKYLPAIVAINSAGLDGNMDVVYDHINYDSLMNSK